jgi:hypothetical protein
MRMSFLILLLLPIFSFGSYTFTCLCSSFLSNSYESVESYVIDDNLKKFSDNIDGVEESLDNNIAILDNNIAILKESNKTIKIEIAQLTEFKSNLQKSKSLVFIRE